MALGAADTGARGVRAPVADGGDGTLDVVLESTPAARVTRHQVSGPLGAPVSARLGWLDAATALVEMAEASGLRLLRPTELDALNATSRGTGELIRAALDGGAARVIVGVGGSATTDGGAGALQALGARLLDARGDELGPGGAALLDLAAFDLGTLDPRLRRVALEVAVDVRNPLLGPDGAAPVFAPQKGASPAGVATLAVALARLVAVAAREDEQGGSAQGPSIRGAPQLAATPGAGAAGGAAFGLALAGARIVAGAPLVCDLIGLDGVLREADLVLTGEGRVDAQTAWGKAPSEVARRAAAAQISCIAIAGQLSDVPAGMFTATISLEEIAAGEDTVERAAQLLRRAAALAVTLGRGR